MARALEVEAPPQQITIAGRRRRAPAVGVVIRYTTLILLTLFFLVPLLWMLSTSFKDSTQVFRDRGFIPQQPTLSNFQEILQGTVQTPVFRWMLNSFIVASVGAALTVLVTSLSAYAFARIDFVGKNLLFSLLITTLLLPGVMFLVPQYSVVNFLGLLNTLPALILPGLAGVFGVFFMRQFFLSVPVEMEEAAYVDGANRLRTFWSVVLPLAGPSIATLAVISFLAYWNDYLWPLIVMSPPDNLTLAPGLRFFQTQYVQDFGLLMAGATLAAAPVLLLYILAQRFIVQSVTSAGIKG